MMKKDVERLMNLTHAFYNRHLSNAEIMRYNQLSDKYDKWISTETSPYRYISRSAFNEIMEVIHARFNEIGNITMQDIKMLRPPSNTSYIYIVFKTVMKSMINSNKAVKLSSQIYNITEPLNWTPETTLC